MTLSCLEFRRIVGAVPASREPAVLAHQLTCPACADFAGEQAGLDRNLERALRISVPDDLKARVIWNHSVRRRRASRFQWAVAAGFVLAVGLGAVLGLLTAERSLSADVIAHFEHEPALLALPADAPPAEPVRVNAVLERGRVRIAEPLDDVLSAGLCPFRGHLVPHLVVRVDGEPVSVLLLVNEPVSSRQDIREERYHGMLVPHGNGSIAIVAPRPELVRPVRERLERAVSWRL